MIHNFGIYDGNFIGKNNDNKIYQSWYAMIRRCYGKNKQDSYENVTIHDEWKYYSNFEKWFNLNCVDGYVLDKDILCGGIKIYSPSTCAFVPNEINNCIRESKKWNNQYPLGVSYHKKKKDMVGEYKKPYYAQHANKQIGSFDSIEAAHQAWQHAKLNCLKDLIDKYKESVKIEVINGLQKRIDMLQQDIINNRITTSIHDIR